MRYFEQRDFVEAFAWKKSISVARNRDATKSTVDLTISWFFGKADLPHKRQRSVVEWN
jgi:hypothetical protein